MYKHSTETLLISTLINAKRPLSTKQIAGYIGICWKTARDNLEKLFNSGLVFKGSVGANKRIYWKNA